MAKLMDYFDSIEDPRCERKKLHRISEILFLILSCSLCGISDYVHMEDFGKAHLPWFRKHYLYKNGIPSHDTLGRVMSLLSPDKFKECFLNWIKSLKRSKAINSKKIAIDGKTLRRSFDGDDHKSAIHMVSAWGCEAGLVLGQEKVDEKSNEIKAIPKLLDMLDIKGCIVTIDAMGCQHKIADQIKSLGGEYILALKGNQGNLSNDVKLFFEDQKLLETYNHTIHESIDGDHGRIESRKCTVVSDIEWLKKRHKNWSSIKSIIKIESNREVKNKTSCDVRYYISSCFDDARTTLQNIRDHWGIENKLHWVLDVQFNEDLSRIRKDHSPENMAIVRHIVLNIINIYKKKHKNISIKRMQNKAAWSDIHRDNILNEI